MHIIKVSHLKNFNCMCINVQFFNLQSSEQRQFWKSPEETEVYLQDYKFHTRKNIEKESILF